METMPLLQNGGREMSEHDAITKAWRDYHGPIHIEGKDSYFPEMPPLFKRGFLYGAEYAKRKRDEAQQPRDFASLFGSGRPEDWEGFEETLELWRNEGREMAAQAEVERDEAREALRTLAEHGENEIQKLIKECDEARNKMADALQEVDLRTLDYERMKQERDEAREALENHTTATIHTCHSECKRPMCVLRRERDQARELCLKLNDLVAYGLGQSGEPWSLDAMRQATAAIQKTKQMGTLPTD